MKEFKFISAVPVWQQGKSEEKNHTLIFHCRFDGGEGYRLWVAAHSRYNIILNDQFFAAGPARAAHGFFRVDEYSLDGRLSEGENRLYIMVAGYNVNSFYLTDQPPFLCAELTKNGEVIACTGKNFTAFEDNERIKKINRYSFQRPFAEGYSYVFNRIPAEAELEFAGEKKFITRTSPYCEYRRLPAQKLLATGTVKKTEALREFKDRSLKAIGDTLGGYKETELEWCPVNEAYTFESSLEKCVNSRPKLTELSENGTALFDMGIITTGYVSIDFDAEGPGTLYIIMNEMLPESGIPDPGRDGCANVIRFSFDKDGCYKFVSFEPYDYKYIQLILTGTSAIIESVSQIRETFPESEIIAAPALPDSELELVFDAAKQSFVQNCTDIYMDCPGRERAGWLCDSFFTSRVEYALTGRSRVEKDFLENFILPEKFKCLPEGMLPMCYPSDHYDGVYIPNWAMWYVLELSEYLDRTGDRELVDSAKNKVLALLDFFKKYENGDGLLEKLDSWIFVEWSRANDFVLDINYPTNMLYAMLLDTVAKLYSIPELAKKAEALRKTIKDIAFDGEFFRDNSVINEADEAVLQNNRTETCQYYAFFTGTATKEEFPELYNKMINEFGPARDAEKQYPDVYEANAFIGNYLRLEIMFRSGMYDRMLAEIRAFFLPMAQKTGTLWENMSNRASCNHGFASHVAYWLTHIFGNKD